TNAFVAEVLLHLEGQSRRLVLDGVLHRQGAVDRGKRARKLHVHHWTDDLNDPARVHASTLPGSLGLAAGDLAQFLRDATLAQLGVFEGRVRAEEHTSELQSRGDL